MILRALVSVSDKTGIADFVRVLTAAGVEVISTGGTYQLLTDNGVPAVELAEYTGFPEIMGGRVKTLHPRIHGGILARRDVDEGAMEQHGIPPIDLVVVNLYPFEAVTADPDCTLERATEYIDIGGPALLRAAAKNYDAVTVVVDPADYPTVMEAVSAKVDVPGATRYRLAAKAFGHTARYDGAIANYLGGRTAGNTDPRFPETLTLQYHKIADMRYGENPHQAAAFYRGSGEGVASAHLLQGKTLSYNNVADVDAAVACVTQFEAAACVIVKHGNPCGVALGSGPGDAYDRAYRTDPTSAFGGIIAFNRPLVEHTAREVVDRQFVEVIATPEVTPEARRVLAGHTNIRVLEIRAMVSPGLELRSVSGGALVQEPDAVDLDPARLRVVTRRTPAEAEHSDLLFAWRVAKFVRSNAIVYARDGQTVGIGAGQMSRVWSARLGADKAYSEGFDVAGAVLASDAFFPFRDGIDTAAAAGVTAVIQPGGSQRDSEVIDAADEHGMAMLFTGIRHFRH